MSELTTLQLARKLADAAIAAYASSDMRSADHEDPPTQAVLRTLRETQSWLTRCPTERKADERAYEAVEVR